MAEVRSSSARRRRVLATVATDRSFEPVEYGGRPAWAAKRPPADA
jgi:hypothetical protein